MLDRLRRETDKQQPRQPDDRQLVAAIEAAHDRGADDRDQDHVGNQEPVSDTASSIGRAVNSSALAEPARSAVKVASATG